MCKRRLVILIEGDDDKDFFDRVIKPRFERKYRPVVLWKYRKKSLEEVNQYLEIEKKRDAEYIFVADNDKLQCVPKKKAEVQKQYHSIDDKSKILIVVKEMEGWYLAGLDENACERLGFSPFKTTDKIGKGKFKKARLASSRSRINFMQDVLRLFDIETAKCKNESFRYFVEDFVRKYGL